MTAPLSSRSDSPEPRSRRSERWLIIGWVLIAAKCAATYWVIDHYHVPIHPLWVVAPTLVFAALCTWIYIWRR